jgi:hypothetical protein
LKRRRVFRPLPIILALVWSTPAEAENQRVLLVHAGAGDPITTHLVDELVAAGFSVEIVPSGDYDLATLAKEHSARAVVRVEASHRSIELWTDAISGVSRIDENPEEKGDLETLSLRAVEELRGKLLSAPPPPKDPIPTDPLPSPNSTKPQFNPDDHSSRTAPVRANEPRRPTWNADAQKATGSFYLRLIPVAMVHPGSGGLEAGGGAMIGARWMFLRRFGADLTGLAPIVPATMTSDVGNVNIAASAVLLGGWADVAHISQTFSFGIGAGAGGGVFHHYGQPTVDGIAARDGNVAYALPYARTGFAWAFLSNLSLRLDFLAAIATPRPVLRLPGRTSDVYFGQPLLTIGLGLDLKLK